MLDPKECPGCQRRAQEDEEKYFAALRTLAATEAGRTVLDYILDRSGVNAPVLWEPSARINYVVARRDFGMEIVEDLAKANFSGYLTMLQDRWNRAELAADAHKKHESDKKERR